MTFKPTCNLTVYTFKINLLYVHKILLGFVDIADDSKSFTVAAAVAQEAMSVICMLAI